MTAIGMTHGADGRIARATRNRSVVRRALLACGVLSSVLYVLTDLLGGLLRYDGYSFASQAVSELMARGAPSESLVDPLFLAYGALLLAFAVGVFREGAGRGRGLRAAGALLMAHAVAGFTGPTLFEMNRRGAVGGASDLPHIVLTALLVVLVLLAIGAAAPAFGPRFRRYSLATLLVMIAIGAASAPYGARLVAGRPTPGLGILERLDIYASLLWIAVLSAMLLRHDRRRSGSRAQM